MNATITKPQTAEEWIKIHTMRVRQQQAEREQELARERAKKIAYNLDTCVRFLAQLELPVIPTQETTPGSYLPNLYITLENHKFKFNLEQVCFYHVAPCPDCGNETLSPDRIQYPEGIIAYLIGDAIHFAPYHTCPGEDEE